MPRVAVPFVLCCAALAQDTAVPSAATAFPPSALPIDAAELKQHAEWLAHDDRQGRYTSTPQQLEVANYIATHFQKLRLKPLGDKKGFLQSYPLHKTYLDAGAMLSCGKHRFTYFALIPGRNAKPNVSGRLVWCGHGARDAFGDGLKGRIAVAAVDKAPRGADRVADQASVRRCLDMAQAASGAGCELLIVCVLDDQSPFANAVNYGALLPNHPVLRYGNEGRDALEAALPTLLLDKKSSVLLLGTMGLQVGDGNLVTGDVDTKVTAKAQVAVKVDEKAVAWNTVAVLEGTTRKNEAVVFSAHMDHVGVRLDGDTFNGADDNASGTAGLLEIAQALAAAGPQPRSIVFLAVSGEELGLWGSHYFSEHPTWPLDKIVANVNIDMIGRAGTEPGRVLMQVTPSHQHAMYSTIVRDAAALARKAGVELTSGDQYYLRSDHYNFARKGIPVVFFCDGEHPDYHQVTDHADKLDFAKMEIVARLAFTTGLAVANDVKKPEVLGKQPDW